jgi:alpha-beta hydrolase superfamily lysophospholipase
MNEEMSAMSCGRENDLIGFLYGELNEQESVSFQRHMRDCDECGAGLASFRNVREDVVSWRNESLSTLAHSASQAVAIRSVDRPSARGALRRFFQLSPAWLKGATAFASLALCLLAGLAIVRLKPDQSSLATNSRNTTYSQQEVDAIVNRRVQDELARLKTDANAVTPSPVSVASTDVHGARPATRKNAPGNRALDARRPLSRIEREQLAADLGLLITSKDSDLDLVDDAINQ